MYRHSDTDRQTDRQGSGQIDISTDKQTERQEVRQIDVLADRQRGKWTDRYIYIKT